MLILVPLFALAATVRAFPSFAGSTPHHQSERFSHKAVLSFRAPAGSPEPEPMAVVDGLKRVPDEDHPFQASGSTDRRGPCPGLNTLANHGYILRNGIVAGDEFINGSVEGLGMGADIVTVLVVLSLAYDGDLLSGKFSIGAPDNRTVGLGALQNIFGVAGGLNYHNTLEGDASTTRQDAYFGDAHSMDPNLYLQMKSIAARLGGDLWLRHHERSPTGLASMLFANGTYGAGGVPNEASISSFLGAHALPDGRYEYVHERFPDNWYRRAEPLNIVEALEMIVDFLVSTNVPFGANAGCPDAFIPFDLGALTDVNGLACFLTALQANIPSAVVQPLHDIGEMLNQILGKITPMFKQSGCPTYNATQAQAYKDLSNCSTFGPPTSQDQAYGRTSS
ncbi:Cloroperoxidase [Dentipellis sp. KUC8613]|nr:Cloroperoxidase [Dentipellis sp. KUC8613]